MAVQGPSGAEKIFVAGHRGLVGSAIVRALAAAGRDPVVTRDRAELDLTRQDQVERFFQAERPTHVYLAAARVGGILANDTRGADFIRDNLLIQTHVIDAAQRHGARKLLFLGSSCIYPKLCPQPMRESHLLNRSPRADERALCRGEDRGHPHGPGLPPPARVQRRMPDAHEPLRPGRSLRPADVARAARPRAQAPRGDARGTARGHALGNRRPAPQFLHVDDLAAACLFVMDRYDGEDILNVGVGEDLSIRDLAELIASVVGFRGKLVFDASKPDGTPRKLLDVSRLRALGWSARIPLRQGIEETYAWYRSTREAA